MLFVSLPPRKVANGIELRGVQMACSKRQKQKAPINWAGCDVTSPYSTLKIRFSIWAGWACENTKWFVSVARCLQALSLLDQLEFQGLRQTLIDEDAQEWPNGLESKKLMFFVSFVGGLSIGTVTWHGFVSKANHDKCCMVFAAAKVQIPATWITCWRLAQERKNWFWRPSFGTQCCLQCSRPSCRPKTPKSASRYGEFSSVQVDIAFPPTIQNGKWLLEGPILDNFHGHWERRKAIMNCPDSCSNNPWRAL